MKDKNIYKIKLRLILRNRMMMVLLFFIYIVLTFADIKTIGLIMSKESYIFRLIHQQIFIIFFLPLLVRLIFNEKTINLLKGYMVIYVNDLRGDLKSTLVTLALINMIFFAVGQGIFSLINYAVCRVVLIDFIIENTFIVFMEICTVLLIMMVLILKFKKDIFVFTIYYSLIVISLMINEVYVTIPLTVKILGNVLLGYSNNYGFLLWFSRMYLLAASYFLYKFVLIKFNKQFYY